MHYPLSASPTIGAAAGAQADGSRYLRYADVEMDLAAYKVRRGGQVVPLAPVKFRLLQLMLSRPGEVFSREALRSRLWGEEARIDLRTVDAHVVRLRMALNAGGRPDLIRTVRTIGYALDVETV